MVYSRARTARNKGIAMLASFSLPFLQHMDRQTMSCSPDHRGLMRWGCGGVQLARVLASLLFVLAAMATWSTSPVSAGQLIQIGSDKQLFLGPWVEDGRDDYLVESMSQVEIAMNPMRVINQKLMPADKPWETPDNYGRAVLRDGELFRCYYLAYPRGQKDVSLHHTILCYAESRDGIHWTKPNLGLTEWEGSRENNILFPNDDFPYTFEQFTTPEVVIDPSAKDPAQRYKAYVRITPVGRTATAFKKKGLGPEHEGRSSLPDGKYAFTSGDGIRWKLVRPEKVKTWSGDTGFPAFWDDQYGQFVAYPRIKPKDQAQTDYYKKKYGFDCRPNVRMVARMVSDDFLDWSGEPAAVLAPDAIDRANSPPEIYRVDFYQGNVSKYTEAPSAYLALPLVHSHWKFDMSDRNPSGYPREWPSTLDVQLATSRDGITWHRTPRRRPFIRLGPKGTFWHGTIYPERKIFRVGDELWVYFSTSDSSHSDSSPRWSFARATMRLDGFLSANAAYTGGELITRPLLHTGKQLQLNLATGAGGTVQVEILDEEGMPIEGFTLDEADEINGNYIRVAASWNGDTNVESLAGQAIKLRFVMRDTKLYSFRFLP